MSVCFVVFDMLTVVRTFRPCHLIRKSVICRQKAGEPTESLLTASHVEGVEGCLKKRMLSEDRVRVEIEADTDVEALVWLEEGLVRETCGGLRRP